MCHHKPKQAIVLGLLDDGVASLRADDLRCLQRADLVIGGHRLLALLAEHIAAEASCFDLTGQLTRLPTLIESALADDQQVVVLATGDPLCHGIGGYLKRKIGLAKLDIRPNLSALQLACARVGISWQDAHICSIHHADSGEWQPERGPNHPLYPLFRACMQQQKIILFTSPENSPARVARMLVAEAMADDFNMIVAEQLMRPDERIIADQPVASIAEQTFAEPNMVILERKAPLPQPLLFGRADHHFAQRKPDKGLITKREVRALSLALLQLRRHSIVWDIGAGSGAVGLEAARLCPDGWVYAIEKNSADIDIARSNQRSMGIHHYTLQHGKAPDGLAAWPDPDAVFIGGSGGELTTLIELIIARLKPGGHLVMNFVTVENLASATACVQAIAVDGDICWSLTQMQVSRSKPILQMHRMAAENPVWIMDVSRNDHGDSA